jgi:hypothetical protein
MKSGRWIATWGATALFAVSACGTQAGRTGFEPSGGSSGAVQVGSSSSGSGGGGNSGGVSVGSSGSSGGSTGVATCPNGGHTTVSGTVYDPAGRVPLYNVVVYVPVPGTTPPAITEGIVCDKCAGAQATGIAVALTDASGHFTLQDVPSGTNIPLVMQIGKWRRQTAIPTVASCQDNPITDPNLTRLPKSQSEGHLPQFAVSTGHSDALECLLRKIGIADSEFTTDSGNGRVHMYVGCVGSDGTSFGANKFAANLGGASFASETTIFSSQAKINQYDVVVLSCEGHKCPDIQTDANGAVLKAFADAGGRVFLDHLHFNWLTKTDIRAWQDSADYNGVGDDLEDPFTTNVDTTFPKGAAMSQWLVNTGASTTAGQLVIHAGQFSVNATIPPMSQQWIYTNDRISIDGTDTQEPGVEYMTINTPVEIATSDPADQCGRMVYTDLHVSDGPNSDSSDDATPFPGGCVTTDLSPQEKALEFMLFDLSSCVQQETTKPVPPPVAQ